MSVDDFGCRRHRRQSRAHVQLHAYGIHDRGHLEPGLAADIVVFDPETVADSRCGG
jgi:N-acyl-D-aspartate/D-glutamate deacylase